MAREKGNPRGVLGPLKVPATAVHLAGVGIPMDDHDYRGATLEGPLQNRRGENVRLEMLFYPNFPTMGIDDGGETPENEYLCPDCPAMGIDDGGETPYLYPDCPAMGIDNENAADRIRIRIGNDGESHSGNGNGANSVSEKLEGSSGLRADSLGLSTLTLSTNGVGVEGCRSHYVDARDDYALMGMK